MPLTSAHSGSECVLSLGCFVFVLWFYWWDDFVAGELSLTASCHATQRNSWPKMHLKLWLYWVGNFGCRWCNGIITPNNIIRTRPSVNGTDLFFPLSAAATTAAAVATPILLCKHLIVCLEMEKKREEKLRSLPSMLNWSMPVPPPSPRWHSNSFAARERKKKHQIK